MPEGQGVRTVTAEEMQKQQKQGAETLLSKKNEEPWWSASLDTTRQLEGPTIPLPPQIRMEQQRHEAARAAAEKAENLRREMARRDEERRRIAQAIRTAHVNCLRCGARCNETPDQSFSFCAECGADLPGRTGSSVNTTRAMPAAPMQNIRTDNTNTGNVRQQQMGSFTTASAPQARVTPGVAATLAFLLPGAGQLANGQAEKGVLLLLGMYIAAFLLNLPALSLPLLVIRVISAIDAYRIAERRKRGQPVRGGEWDIS